MVPKVKAKLKKRCILLKELQEAVTSIKSLITCPLEEEVWAEHWWAHRYDSMNQNHLIMIPACSIDQTEESASERWLLNYLHELVHAYYSEKIHPLFGGFDFEDDYPQELIETVSDIHRNACDWFIWGKLFELVPKATIEDIKRHHDKSCEMDSLEHSMVEGNLFTYIMLKALSFVYLLAEIEKESIDISTPSGEVNYSLNRLIQVYTDVPNENPTIENLETLMNEMLSIFSAYKVRLAGVIFYPTWEIIIKEE
jgi:hypothetical protein